MKIQLSHKFEDIINLENILEAWPEFLKGKKRKKDVQVFQLNLMDNIFLLGRDLSYHTYQHGSYQAFNISDPKPRRIHKATVRDRLLHHTIYRKLYPFFDKIFIADSYSCRIGKGTHKAVNRLGLFLGKLSKNNTRNCWALKCDIQKFFASINHDILLSILREYIPDENIIKLLARVIKSFSSAQAGVGLPLGNLTSQLFANIYLNKLDQFIKHKLKVKYYLRYTDDFVIVFRSRLYLRSLLLPIRSFLSSELAVKLHPRKIIIRKFSQGIDFLGYVILPRYRLLRTKTRRRLFKNFRQRIEEYKKGLTSRQTLEQSRKSYLGVMAHANCHELSQKLENFR